MVKREVSQKALSSLKLSALHRRTYCFLFSHCILPVTLNVAVFKIHTRISFVPNFLHSHLGHHIQGCYTCV